jgi:DNA helicase-2/ATP-dependent DNA helicase PcrA
LVRRWYQPHLERLHDNPGARAGDIDQLEQIAGTYPTRSSFLTELTLDPPEATSAAAVPPHLDEDYLVLSTIHSAKGQEWDAVFVLNVIDGCIPSDMAVGSREQIEEERRLLYVAMTRARDHLHLVQPMRLFRGQALGITSIWCSRCACSADISIGMATATFWLCAAASFPMAFSMRSSAGRMAAP